MEIDFQLAQFLNLRNPNLYLKNDSAISWKVSLICPVKIHFDDVYFLITLGVIERWDNLQKTEKKKRIYFYSFKQAWWILN